MQYIFISFDCKCEQLYEIAQKPISITPALKNYIMAIVDEGLIYLSGKNYIPQTIKQKEFAKSAIFDY